MADDVEGQGGRELPETAAGVRTTPAASIAGAEIDSSDPSPPRPPATRSEAIKLVGGLIVVIAGLFVLLVIALVAILSLNDKPSEVVAVASSAFGVIGTVIGAYFGVKIGTDGTQSAVAGMKDEASKAQAFAAHVPMEEARDAISHANALAAGMPPAPRSAEMPSRASTSSRVGQPGRAPDA